MYACIHNHCIRYFHHFRYPILDSSSSRPEQRLESMNGKENQSRRIDISFSRGVSDESELKQVIVCHSPVLLSEVT